MSSLSSDGKQQRRWLGAVWYSSCGPTVLFVYCRKCSGGCLGEVGCSACRGMSATSLSGMIALRSLTASPPPLTPITVLSHHCALDLTACAWITSRIYSILAWPGRPHWIVGYFLDSSDSEILSHVCIHVFLIAIANAMDQCPRLCLRLVWLRSHILHLRSQLLFCRWTFFWLYSIFFQSYSILLYLFFFLIFLPFFTASIWKFLTFCASSGGPEWLDLCNFFTFRFSPFLL